MTKDQYKTVQGLAGDGFKVVTEGGDIVRMSKGADHRVIMANGMQKRGHHKVWSKSHE